jgi:hypothetical protein
MPLRTMMGAQPEIMGNIPHGRTATHLVDHEGVVWVHRVAFVLLMTLFVALAAQYYRSKRSRKP